MSDRQKNPGGHLLLYEPRTEGHHLGWLRFITEDLLAAGLTLTLALDRRPEHEEKIQDHLGELLTEVKRIDSGAPPPNCSVAAKASQVAGCLRRSGAANVFLCAWDEIASDCWRRAALGLYPQKELRGRMGGIYHRPRFLAAQGSFPRRWPKRTGFERMIHQGWLRQLLFVDEYLTQDLQKEFPSAPFFFLPDPCPRNDRTDQTAARRKLGVPDDRRVFLFYGGGYRRKGLHLAVQAMRALPPAAPAFLLCLGQLNPAGETARHLEELIRANRARLINRYASTAEEKAGFAASDVVLLPYIHHFGTSGVLSRAMSAGKMVIVSDEELLGRLTRDHGLGMLFPTGNAAALGQCLREAVALPPETLNAFALQAEKYARRYSREAYRRSLVHAILQSA
jgi:glycosyltransferase involved in cell wall biosynthesis